MGYQARLADHWGTEVTFGLTSTVAEYGRETKSAAFQFTDHHCTATDRGIPEVDSVRHELIRLVHLIVACGVFNLPAIRHGCCPDLRLTFEALRFRGRPVPFTISFSSTPLLR